MVDVKDFDILSLEEDIIKTHGKLSENGFRIIISFFVVLFGAVFSGGRPEILTLSVLVSVFVFILLSEVNQYADYVISESRFKKLQKVLHQMNLEIEELKQLKN